MCLPHTCASATWEYRVPFPLNLESTQSPALHILGERPHDPPATMAFSSIPVLDFSLARNPDTKEPFLDSLRHALLEVGFLYIKNVGISDALIKDVINQGRAFFDLPEEKKLEVQMKNVPSFLGIVVACFGTTAVKLRTLRLQQIGQRNNGI